MIPSKLDNPKAVIDDSHQSVTLVIKVKIKHTVMYKEVAFFFFWHLNIDLVVPGMCNTLLFINSKVCMFPNQNKLYN
jgi:hypothetical protein